MSWRSLGKDLESGHSAAALQPGDGGRPMPLPGGASAFRVCAPAAGAALERRRWLWPRGEKLKECPQQQGVARSPVWSVILGCKTETLKAERPSGPQLATQNQESCGRGSDAQVSPVLRPVAPAFPKTQQEVVPTQFRALREGEGGFVRSWRVTLRKPFLCQNQSPPLGFRSPLS